MKEFTVILHYKLRGRKWHLLGTRTVIAGSLAEACDRAIREHDRDYYLDFMVQAKEKGA